LIRVKDSLTDKMDGLMWKWNRGDATDVATFGDPSTTTGYRLCVYDTVAGVSALATELEIGPSVSWLDKRPRGWKYNDKTRSVAGVQSITLRAGETGKAKIQLKAKGDGIPMPLPVGTERFFTQDPSVVVQVVNDDGACWSGTYTTPGTSKNTGQQFKAKESASLAP